MTDVGGSRTPAPDFDAMYAADADPWRVSSSWYERRKLAVMLACLPRERYRSAWEPGCGPGFTTVALAPRVDSLVCSDSSAVAIDAARRRSGHLPHVRCVVSTLPCLPVHDAVDLVIVAEFLYYVGDLDGALDTLWSALAAEGQLVVMHWAHHPHDAFRSGRDMHASVARDADNRGATRRISHLDDDFILDIYESPA